MIPGLFWVVVQSEERRWLGFQGAGGDQLANRQLCKSLGGEQADGAAPSQHPLLAPAFRQDIVRSLELQTDKGRGGVTVQWPCDEAARFVLW